jgi:hypothetical protein
MGQYMNAKSFLEKVLAEQDNYVLWIKTNNSRRSWNKNYTNITSLLNAIQEYDKDPNLTVYMAIGSFKDNLVTTPNGKPKVLRTTECASYFKSFCCDLDVDPKDSKKFATAKEAVGELWKACDTLRIPRPILIQSGVGIHPYWALKTAISAGHWVQGAQCLRAAFDSVGMKYDPSKIDQPTMVLRPVGSTHKKDPANPKPVRLLQDQPAIEATDLAHIFIKFKKQRPTRSTRSKRTFAKQQDSILEAILEGGTPVNLDDLRKCNQIDALLKTNGATDYAGNPVSEPLWRASLGIAKFCEAPESAAVQLSSGHPEFDEEACLDKLNGWHGTGPTNCSTFGDLCESGCKGCQFKGNITSPAQLTGGVTEIPVSTPDSEDSKTIKLPQGYLLKDRCLYRKHPRLEEEVFVSPYFLWVASRIVVADAASNQALLGVDFPIEGVKYLPIEASIIAAGGKDLRIALADKQIYIKEDIEPLREYLMTYLRRLQREASPEISFNHFGWQPDGSFLLGEELIGAKNPPSKIHLEGIAGTMQELLKPKGKIEAWSIVSEMFNLRGMEFQNFAASLALGAPVAVGGGIDGGLLNMYSEDSGSGKTLTGWFGLAAFGNPKELGFKPKDTANSKYKALGIRGNWGGYVDDLLVGDNNETAKFIMQLQDGREPQRLSRDASGFRDQAKWSMPIISSTNHDIWNYLYDRGGSEATELRVLQLTCPRVDWLSKNGSKNGSAVQMALRNNYGHAGRIIIKEILAAGGPDALYMRMYNSIPDLYGVQFLGEERFYQHQITVAHCGGWLATKAGIIRYDYRIGIQAVCDEIARIRRYRRSQRLEALDYIMMFLNEKTAETVQWLIFSDRPPYAREPTPERAVARIEQIYDDKQNTLGGTIYLHREAFRHWARLHGKDLRPIIDGLNKEGVSVVPNIRKVIYSGVSSKSAAGQLYCISLDIASHPRLLAACNSRNIDPEAKPSNRLALA